MRVYRNAVVLFAVTFVALGIALVVVTAVHGGASGYLLGLLFIALGIGRGWLALRRR